MTDVPSDKKPDAKDDATEIIPGDDDGATEIMPGDDDGATEILSGKADDATALMSDKDEQSTELMGGSAATQATSADHEGTLATGTPPPVSRANPLAAMRPGYVLKDRFTLKDKLGEGGMGAVFRAVDQRKVETRHPNPAVAIKLITGNFAQDSRAFIALQRETDKSQTLAHPNIITVYDFDRDGDVFFMTMESLQGDELEEYVKKKVRDRELEIGFITDIAKGIAYAHERNIVHSDLKPANVFVTDEGKLKILDFGIARAAATIEGQSPDPDELVGLTPAYASCEMFEGKDPHPADDVYAIGLIAYELLTGEHPFGRKRATDARKEGLKPQKIKGLTSYQWKAIAGALTFNREDRLQNAGEFLRLFTGAGRRVKQLSMALAIAVIGSAVFFALYEPEAGPDIPFEELPIAQQQEITGKLDEGRTALKFGDLDGALFYFDKAYTLHPRNLEATAELDNMVETILDSMNPKPTPDERETYLFQVDQLLRYESLSQNPALLERQKTLRDL